MKLKNLKMKLLKKTNGNNKKSIENLVVFLLLLIITVIAINTIWGNDSKKSDNSSSYKTLAKDTEKENILITSNIMDKNEYNLQEDLEDILSKIEGVGKVKVLITYSETSEVIAMYNESYSSSSTEEEDDNGGTRKVSQANTDKEVIFEENNGKNIPVTQKVLMPKIEGAIISAEGGGNANIKTNIIQAVAAATGLATYKVQVFEMAK